MAINYARLNHILIPSTKAGRDRFRRGLLGRALGPLAGVYSALSDEGRALAVASLMVGALGVDVQATSVYVLWSAMVALLVGSLLVTRAFKLGGVSLQVVAPRRVTVGEDMKFAVVLTSTSPRDALAVRVSGPFLPWDGRWTGPSPHLARLPAGGTARVEQSARFAGRGEHHLDPFSAAALVPLGLAQGPSIESSGCKFLVVPKIANLVRLTNPAGVRYQPGGIALASKTGESMDLLGVRPYRPGDPVRSLHAKSWARAGAPVVREYQEEYFTRIAVLVDTAAPDERRLEAILSLAAGVVAHLSRGEALIDLLVVGEQVHDLTIGRHLGFLDQALDLLACVEMDKKRPPPERVFSRLSPHLARLSCVVVVAGEWDQGALAQRIRGSGVGCTTLVVEGEGASLAPRGKDVHAIAVGAIERGEALAV